MLKVQPTILASCLALAACGSTSTSDVEQGLHAEWGHMVDGGSFRYKTASGARWSFNLEGPHLTLAVEDDRLVLFDAVPATGLRFATQDLDTPDITFMLSDDVVVRWQGRDVRVRNVHYEVGPKAQLVPVGVGGPWEIDSANDRVREERREALKKEYTRIFFGLEPHKEGR